MTTEPLADVYARLACKVKAQMVECLHDDGLESRIQRQLATCGKCNNTGRAPDPKYAALREAFWRNSEFAEGTQRILRPLDMLDAGKLAEAMRCIGTPFRIEITEKSAWAWFGNDDLYARGGDTLLEAVIRAADAAMEEKPCIVSNAS